MPKTNQIVIATANGKVLVVDIDSIPVQPRNGSGARLMDVGPDDYIVAVAEVPEVDE